MNDRERIDLLVAVIQENREETELIIQKLLTEISKLKNSNIKLLSIIEGREIDGLEATEKKGS